MSVSFAKFSRRKFLHLASATVAGSVLSACLPISTNPVPVGTQKVQLVYQDWRADWFLPMVKEMLHEFHALHPNIRVFYITDPDNVGQKMLVDMQAGTAPDVFQGCCDYFPVWAQKDYTLNLRAYVEEDLDAAILTDWDPVQYQAFFTPDGKLYGLPKYHDTLAIYYNKDIFDEYAVPYPDATWTYEDYLTAMKRLTISHTQGGKIDIWGSMFSLAWDRLQAHINSWGGHFVDPNNATRCLMDKMEAMDSFSWLYKRIWEDHSMPTILDINQMKPKQAFINQRVAMIEETSLTLKDILSQARFRVGVAPFPIGPGRRVSMSGVDGFGIYAGTKHPDAAWELVKFLISKEYGRAMTRANLLQPARSSLLEEWVTLVQQEFPEQTKGFNTAIFTDGHLQGYSVSPEVFADMERAKQLAYVAWDKIFTLGQTDLSEISKLSRQIEAVQPQTQGYKG